MPRDTNQPVDPMAPWTIKSFSTTCRERITTEAMKAGQTNGHFVERGMTEWMDAGSPVRVEQQGSPAASSVDLSSRVADVTALAEAAARLAGVSGRHPVVQAARAVVRATLLSLHGPQLDPAQPETLVSATRPDPAQPRAQPRARLVAPSPRAQLAAPSLMPIVEDE